MVQEILSELAEVGPDASWRPSLSPSDFQLTPTITSSFSTPRSPAASTSASNSCFSMVLALAVCSLGTPSERHAHLHFVPSCSVLFLNLGWACDLLDSIEGSSCDAVTVLGLSLKNTWPLLLYTLESSELPHNKWATLLVRPLGEITGWRTDLGTTCRERGPAIPVSQPTCRPAKSDTSKTSRGRAWLSPAQTEE